MVYAGKMIRFFISSTFYDMQLERNALQERVFPELRRFCRERGAHLQAIDLRWGVSQEASQDQRTLAICLEEIRRCRKVSPHFNFLVLLGERHGSDLLPEQIAEDEFKKLLTVMSDSDREKISPWYRRDDNAYPPVYILQPKSEQYHDDEIWAGTQEILHMILVDASRRAKLDKTAQVKYVASATEIEIIEGVFKYTDEEEQPLCFFRTIEGAPQDGSAPLYIERDPEKRIRLFEMKRRLKERSFPEAIYEYTAHWDESSRACSKDHLAGFCNAVSARLKARIGTILDQPDHDQERDAVKEFVAEHTRNFVGRNETVATVTSYLSTSIPYPLVITGESGSGKSTLLAYIAGAVRHVPPGAALEEFYIGVTPDSSNTRMLLTNLWDRITRVYGHNATTSSGEVLRIPADEQSLIKHLPDLLRLAKADKPLLLFVDALDQLREGSQGNWLPRTLPPHVRMVVSTLPGTVLDTLKQSLPSSQIQVLEKMTRKQGDQLLSSWLGEEAQRTLQPAQRAAVLDRFETNGLPLYLRLAFEEARRWSSYQEKIPELAPDVKGILRNLFERLAQGAYHGRVLVEHGLGYLGAARNGLSEDEVLDLLARDEQVFADIKRLSPASPVIDSRLPFPVVLWSRLYFDLNPYLTERSADGANLIGFYHQQLAEVVKEIYLQGDAKLARHRALAQYFKSQGVASGSLTNLRKLAEQPFQQTEGEQWDDLYATLTDFAFLEHKVATGEQERMNLAQVMTKTYSGVYDLQRDFENAIDRWTKALQKGEAQ